MAPDRRAGGPETGATGHRPHLRDPGAEERYESVGFVVLRGAARRAVRPLRRLHRRVVGAVPPGFHSTPYDGDGERKRQVHQGILAELQPVLDDVLVGHRPLLCSYISKARGSGGAMPPHQDWTFVDEPMCSSMNVWVPLVDVDGRNGAMSVLPGGHLVPHNLRGSGTENSFADIEAAVSELMVEVPMRAGDVLVHDHRVLHASPPNRRRRPRLVAGCAVVAADATAVHYWQASAGVVERHELEDSFFTDHTFGASELPPSARYVASVAYEAPRFTIGEVAHLADRGVQHGG